MIKSFLNIAPLMVVLLAAGCNKVTGIVFTVDASAPVTGIARLHGTATLNGGTPAPFDLTRTGQVSIPPALTFSIQLPDAATGTLQVQLQALSDDGSVLATGAGTAAVIAHGVQKDAHITLTPGSGALVFDSSSHDFDMVMLAQMSQPFTFTATNNGSDQTGAPTVTIDGANGDDFTFTTDCNNPIPSAGTCSVNVVFAPSMAGMRSATLHLTASPGGEATAMLTGTGAMPAGAAFAITPPKFQFMDTAETMSGDSTAFTVKNVGGAASPTLGNSTIVGGMTGSYVMTTDGCFAKVLQPNDTCMVTVQFKPVAAGLQTSTLSVAGAGATLNGRGIGTYHDEGSTNGGPGGGTFWNGAFAPSSDEIVVTSTTGSGVYFMTPGKPATLSAATANAASGAQLNKVWGPSKGSVYFVDNKGEVLHYSGGSAVFNLFNTGNIFPNGCCSGVWGFSDTNFYVVGGATAAHYDGAWHTQTVSATSPVLNAIWGSAANNLFAVGNGGLIVHNTGANDTWTPMTSGTTYDLKAIYGSGASDIYAVGYTIGPPSLSVILHYDGTSWTPQSSGLANAQLGSVFVAPDGEAWIGDLLTSVLHSTGNGMWTNVSSVGNLERWQIAGTSDHDVYIFSEDGDILHYY